MFKRTITAALIFGAAAIAPPAVHAQSNCAPRDSVIERLKEKYSERLTGGGVQNSDTVLEIWSSEKTGSFTVLITHANGMSCVVSSGQNWNSVVAATVPKGTAS